MSVTIQIASTKHIVYAEEICALIEKAAHQRGTGIAKRDPEYIKKKIKNGNAVIALDENRLTGFCYIEIWENKKYVVNSGLIVHPDYRGQGLAKKIKARAFQLSRKKYPESKLFGITTSLPVMKINSELGYKPVTFSELTQDETFWRGCQSCPNYQILQSKDCKNCLCTGMLFDPNEEKVKSSQAKSMDKAKNVEKFHRWVRLKTMKFFKNLNLAKIFS